MTAFLYHGPGARSEAEAKQMEYGIISSPPVGEFGLKVAEARAVVDLMKTPSIGDTVGSVLIGPMDQASSASSDVLLKSLEELNSEQVQPVLWAEDLAGVRPTIVSRCEAVWVNGPPKEDQDSVLHLAFDIMEAVMAEDKPRVLDLVLEGTKDVDLNSLVGQMVRAVSVSMLKPTTRVLEVWFSLRKLLLEKKVDKAGLLLCLLEA